MRELIDIHKTRMNGLSCGKESMTIRSAVLIQYQRVTDRQTDRRTDVRPISITCLSIADARINVHLITSARPPPIPDLVQIRPGKASGLIRET